ncbi:MAG TPA: protein translocase subunit SecD [Gammaproteobacteria bacterium]|nr:protein translocase subunit SecD [Gammaproteobacteria bacterium]
MNQSPAWKYLLLAFFVIVGTLYALPNLFGEQPALQITTQSGQVSSQLADQAKNELKSAGLSYQRVSRQPQSILIRMPSTQSQLKGADVLKRKLPSNATVALNLAPRTPGWLRDIGASAMPLGLDLRGGVYFLLKVDIKAALKNSLSRYETDLPTFLRKQDIRYAGARNEGDKIDVLFRNTASRDKALKAASGEFRNLTFKDATVNGNPALTAQLSQQEVQRIRQFAIKQNLTTIRNRVNELGVSEPVVQQQGPQHIVVQLPGVQDSAQAKNVLGATATLEFHLVDEQHDAQAAEQSGNVPSGDELYKTRNGRPVLIKRDVIATGDQLVDASYGMDHQSGSPAVFVTLSSTAADKMLKTTEHNIGHRMAVLYIQNRVDTVYENGKPHRIHHTIKQVISDATIQGVFSKRFQITGLSVHEARNLALLLRAGALAAPVEIVQERTIGPSLGKDNIQKGLDAVLIAFVAVVLFMAFYYRAFGLIADMALVLNLVLIVAAMSLLQATLTLPGIAGIVLTIGMAVDANVLIFERIREEIKAGSTPQASINAGYDKAFATIADSNITTLVAGLVLFIFGTGPIKGFAVTLSIGIVTSLFTAIVGTRALVNLLWGGRRVRQLPV